MKLTQFRRYAESELSSLRHPHDPEQMQEVTDIDDRMRTIDYVLRQGAGPYAGLAENFYEALGQYLNAPRHNKALVSGAIERLAMHFEGFLRTAVASVAADRDAEMQDAEGRARGLLSQQGYVGHILSHLCGIKIPASAKSEKKRRALSIEEAIYTMCFKHQQRAKHESRIYSLAELEALAAHVISAYLLFAEWLLSETKVGELLKESAAPSSRDAVLHWPGILDFQLGELWISREDGDLQEDRDRLRQRVEALREKAEELGDRVERPDDDAEFETFRLEMRACAEEYEQLVSEVHMREWGREAQYSEYM